MNINFIKTFLVVFFILGAIGISIVKNISVQKQNYITQLEFKLYEQQEKFNIYKIQWDHLTSPITLESKINGYTLEKYNKTFIVINEESLSATYQNDLDSMFNVNTKVILNNVGK
jgi:hypothetical protein|tara:strand:- start:157 stop:501 length:345 start_codon:yes stop_codon:yes gene_type:complete